MTTSQLYRGLWPQNVSKLAKYSVRSQGDTWKVTVAFDVGDGLTYLAVDGGDSDLASRVNDVKTTKGQAPGGVFYVNEYRHVIVPIAAGGTSHYYFAGKLAADFRFEFEGAPLSTRPIDGRGQPLHPGDKWVGPRPGVPYVLAAGGGDIYYETPALTATDPPTVRPSMTQKVQLSKVLKDASTLARATAPVQRVRGHRGGRFYANEHGALFSPVDAGDGNGLDYIYCGQIDPKAWFPEPPTR